jgi:UPF0716 protein FxsA
VGFIILAFFIGVPILEIAVFIEVGERIGLGWTLASVVATAIIGTVLLRYQGFATLARAQQQMSDGRPPVMELLEGVGLLIAACLLLTPGFVTDAAGALLLVPPIRRFLAMGAIHKIVSKGRFSFHQQSSGTRQHRHDDGVIDGEFEDVTADPGPEDRKKIP